MKKKKSVDPGKEAELSMELMPNPQILIVQNKHLAHKCDSLKKEIENFVRTQSQLEKANVSLNALVSKIINGLSEAAAVHNDGGGTELDFLKSTEHKKLSLAGRTDEVGMLMEETKESTVQEVPEPIRTQDRVASHLLELLQKTEKHKSLTNGRPEDQSKHLEAKMLKAAVELETTKAALKKAEEENKQKAKTIEELEGKVGKLTRRIDTSPWSPYALIQKHHFDQQMGPHDCLCIICGEKMRAPPESSGDSPEPHTPESSVARTQPVSSDPNAVELAEKIKTLEEEVQHLTAENIELKRDIAEKLPKADLTEDMVLKSDTFDTLLTQARQMAQSYIDLKGKYLQVKERNKELRVKYERDMKEVMAQESKRIQQIIDEVCLAAAPPEKRLETMEQITLRTETEKYYKNIIDLHKAQIATLEADLSQAEKQLDALKKDRKKVNEVHDKKSEEAIKIGDKESDKLKKLNEILQQKSQELASERQMGEMWISELEVASKAYDQEKKKNKLLAQEIEKLNENIAKAMMDACKESKQRMQCEEELNLVRNKVSLLEKEAKEQRNYKAALEQQCKKYEEAQGLAKTLPQEQLSVIKELKDTCQKQLAKIEDLKKEIECEKKLVEEWQTRCFKSEAQKGMSDQVDKLMNQGEMLTKDPEEQVKVLTTVVETYKNMLRCKVCKTRNKDVVLARCCHLFCRECITKNLQMRQRHCPTCRQKFTADDVRQIWWDS